VGIIKGYDNTIIDYADSTKKIEISSGVATSTVPIDAGANAIKSTHTPSADADLVNLKHFREQSVVKNVALAATTVADGNQTLSGLTGTIDGQNKIAGTTYLLTQQTSGPENGLWVANASAWTRPTDWPAGSSQSEGRLVIVDLGTSFENTVWVSEAACVVDTSDPGFAQTTWSAAAIASALAAKVNDTGDTITGQLILDRTDDGAPLDIRVNNPLVAPPMVVDSAIVVTNLNADKLDGQDGSYYAAASSLSSYLPLAGGTMAGNIAMGTNTLTNVGTPVALTDVATKGYVDGVDELKTAVKCAIATNAGVGQALPAHTYSAGVITVTAPGALAVNTYSDGQTLIVGDRVLIFAETGTPAENGIYTVKTVGATGVQAQFERAADWYEGMAFSKGWGCYVTDGTFLSNFLYVAEGSGTVNTDSPVFTPTGKNYVDSKISGLSSTYVAKAGDTMTGDLTISKASPTLILNDTASSPANQTAKLYRSGTESGFVADVTMATNFGNMATINAGGFGKTASLPTITGTSFSILSIFSVPAHSSANIGMAINNGSGTNIPHLIEMQNFGGTTSRFIFAREVGGVSKYTSIIDNPLGYHLGSNLVTIVCVFNQTTDSMTYSINGNPFVTANFSNTGYMGGSAAWGSEVFAIATRDLITTRTGVSYADVALVDGEVSIADSIWYYNGGSGQTTASIDGRTWDGGGTLIHHWDADETPGAQVTLDDSIGTLDITAATGTFTVAAVPSTFTQVAYPFTVNPSSVPGVRSEQTNGDQYGYTAQIGREFMVEMFDEDTGTDILVAKFNKTLAEIKAATINLGYGANHKISSSGNIELFSGLHELTSAGDIKLFNEQHNVTQSSVNMFSGRHEFTSGEIKFFGASGSPQFSALAALGSFVWSDFVIVSHTLTQTVSAFNTKGSNMAAAMNLSIARTNKMLADLVRRGDYQTLGS